MFSSKDVFFGSQSVGGYQIAKSLRFRSSASAYLSRTFSTPTNASKWTKSFWIKRGALGTVPILAAQTVNASANYAIQFNSDNTITWQFSNTLSMVTTQVFRDPSAWYHFVLVWDVGNATAANRAIIYVNGVQINNFTTDNRSSLTTTQNAWGTAGSATISYTNGTNSLDGYLADVYFIDGQALTPSSFGANDATTGVWGPKAYSGGSYGTNGFYLKFADNSAATAAAIGKDSSGNGNNWTPNNISVTAGATYDSMIDTPTPYDNGGTGVGNYCTLNPLASNAATLSNANLKESAAAACSVYGTMASSGKLYFEVTVSFSVAGFSYFGVALASTSPSAPNSMATLPAGYWVWRDDALKGNNGSSAALGTALTTGQIGMVAYDPTTGNLWFGAQNVWFGSGNPATGANPSYTLTAGTVVVPVVGSQGASGASILEPNFGQRPFTYTPPTGFKALNTQNLPTPTIAAGGNYMLAVLYNGTSASNTVVATSSNSGNNPLALTFQPDLVWIKSRSAATNHELTDAVRGVTKSLVSNSTAAEATDTNGLTAFTSTGFTVGSDSNYNNGTGPATYVAWEWKGGNGTVSNASGSITSTVSANATAGFSVVTYTGTGSTGTVGHGLGVTPNMIIMKDRGAVGAWPVFHSSLANMTSAYLGLNTTNAVGTLGSAVAAPTSSTFGISGSTSSATTCVAYCFAAVAGYSAFGSYTGNGSADGPFVFTGFRPRYVLVKRTDSTSDWYIWDTARDTYNVESATLLADTSGAETSVASIDGLSNGFKCRSSTVVNASGGTYIYAAFCENPLKYSLAR